MTILDVTVLKYRIIVDGRTFDYQTERTAKARYESAIGRFAEVKYIGRVTYNLADHLAKH